MEVNITTITNEDLVKLFSSEEFTSRLYEGLQILKKEGAESGFNCARSIYDNQIFLGDVVSQGESHQLNASDSLEKVLNEHLLDEIEGSAYRIFNFHYHPGQDPVNILMSEVDLMCLCYEKNEYGHDIDVRLIVSTGIYCPEENSVRLLLLQRKSDGHFDYRHHTRAISLCGDDIYFHLSKKEMSEDESFLYMEKEFEASTIGLNCTVLEYEVGEDKLRMTPAGSSQLEKFTHTPKILERSSDETE